MNIQLSKKLLDIFVRKNWTTQESYMTVWENFCLLLSNLEKDAHKDLILELSSRYSWVSLNEYQKNLTTILKSIEAEKLKACKRIIVFPIMKPKKKYKLESSHTIIYMIRGLAPLIPVYQKIKIEERLEYKEMAEDKLEPEDSDLIFLVDDYLGTGETLEATINQILSNKKVKPNHLNIIAVASQQTSIDLAKSYGISIYFGHLEKKGISDYYDTDMASQKLEMMLEIEELIKSGKKYRFGYNQSEALITLMRTPNNTFPIFWSDYIKDNREFKAPFPRY